MQNKMLFLLVCHLTCIKMYLIKKSWIFKNQVFWTFWTLKIIKMLIFFLRNITQKIPFLSVPGLSKTVEKFILKPKLVRNFKIPKGGHSSIFSKKIIFRKFQWNVVSRQIAVEKNVFQSFSSFGFKLIEMRHFKVPNLVILWDFLQIST